MIDIDYERNIIKRNGLSDKSIYKALNVLRFEDSLEGAQFRQYSMPLCTETRKVWKIGSYTLVKTTYTPIEGWSIHD